MFITLIQKINQIKPVFKIFFLVLASLGIILAIYYFLPFGEDWMGLRDASIKMATGSSPNNDYIFNPPWILLLLFPIAILPVKLGAAILSFLNFAAYGYAALRMGKSPLLAVLLLLTPAMVRLIIDPNLEFLVAIGLILPPPIGIFLILAKPQLGAIVAIFWVIEAWRNGGVRKFAQLIAPITIVTLASFVIYGVWPLHWFGVINSDVNASMWPTSIIFGVPMIVYAIRSRQMNLALLSTPFLTPYYGFYSLQIPLLGFLPRRDMTIAAVIGFWITFFLGLH